MGLSFGMGIGIGRFSGDCALWDCVPRVCGGGVRLCRRLCVAGGSCPRCPSPIVEGGIAGAAGGKHIICIWWEGSILYPIIGLFDAQLYSAVPAPWTLHDSNYLTCSRKLSGFRVDWGWGL